MALPQGIDFRATSGYVSDPANCTYDTTPNATISYPRTTPQGNTVGWEQGLAIGGQNSSAGAPDPRLAGFSQTLNTQAANFRIDLPAPGSYQINLAAGTYASGAFNGPVLALYDNATLLTTIDNGTVAVPGGSFLDAAGNIRTATDWVANNTPLVASFGSTVLRAKLGDGVASRSSLITHLFVQAAAGGATTWNLTISEAASLADVPSASALFASALTEAITLADMPIAAARFAPAVAESLTLADTPGAAALFLPGVAESIVLADAPAATATFAASLAEELTLAETRAATSITSASIAESLVLADTISTGAATFSLSIAEAMGLTDTVAAMMAYGASVAEAVTLADVPAATAIYSAPVAESLTFADAPSATVLYTTSIADSLALADALSGASEAPYAAAPAPASRTVALPFAARQIAVEFPTRSVTIPFSSRRIVL